MGCKINLNVNLLSGLGPSTCFNFFVITEKVSFSSMPSQKLNLIHSTDYLKVVPAMYHRQTSSRMPAYDMNRRPRGEHDYPLSSRVFMIFSRSSSSY